MQLQREGHLNGGYGKHVVNRIQFALDNHMGEVKGKHFLVVGSERPWIEALLLLAGAYCNCVKLVVNTFYTGQYHQAYLSHNIIYIRIY